MWERLAQLDPEAVLPVVHRARVLERAGRLNQAEAEFRRALERSAEHPMVLGDLARFYRVHRRYNNAIEIYQAYLRLEPKRMDAILGIGQCLDRLNRLDEAQAYYDMALALDAANVTALGYRARLLRTRGQVDAAIVDFRRICKLEPTNAGAWHELIFQLAGAEREEEALAALGDAEVALGDTPQTWSILARACAAALFDDRAIDLFERAIAAEPANAQYRAQFGLYFHRQGILDKAFHTLLDSRELDPRNVQVARRLFDVTRALQELGYDHASMRHEAGAVEQILVPERLFDLVRRIADTQVVPYKPVPRRLVTISATLAAGGAERQLVTMLNGLCDPRFSLDLSLFCTSLSPRYRRDFYLPTLEGTGIDIVMPDPASTLEYLSAPEVMPYAEIIRHFPPDMVGPIAFWLGEFRRRRPQVVHAWQDLTSLMAVVAALLAGVPRIVLCCRSVRPDNPRRRLRRFMKEAYQAVLSHPSVVLSNNSRAGADDYAEWLGLNPASVEVVYNGIDFDRLKSDASAEATVRAREELGIPDGAPVLGGVFRMSEEKRPLLWVEVAALVAAENPAVHFVICGDGPMRDEMLNLAAERGISDRVHMPGAQPNIGSWFKMMDLVMLTSRHEGLPNVLLEAQSLGVPVVAPDVGGMSEVVEQGVTGWTIKDADAAKLAERVLFCLSDQSWRQPAVERAPRFVRERFGIEAMLRRNLQVYGIAP
jgi:glycosyltransferase involved in cell wall biosynthesis/Tfp pilus assembly protein PilF